MCRSREQAKAALARLRELLAELGLEPKEAKTRIVHLQVGGGGVDFLGFHHRLVRSQGRRGTGKGSYASNAMGNFCFDVTLSYRRLERPRRVTDGA
jgi:hypothetical protein